MSFSLNRFFGILFTERDWNPTPEQPCARHYRANREKEAP